jgi:hypothetical protein
MRSSIVGYGLPLMMTQSWGLVEPLQRALEHDPQKWNPLCGKIMLKLLIWRMFLSIR